MTLEPKKLAILGFAYTGTQEKELFVLGPNGHVLKSQKFFQDSIGASPVFEYPWNLIISEIEINQVTNLPVSLVFNKIVKFWLKMVILVAETKS